MALLDSHGIQSFRISGNPQAIWPMTVNAMGQIQIAVASPRPTRRSASSPATVRRWARGWCGSKTRARRSSGASAIASRIAVCSSRR
jgi:hypothetical protein